LDNIDRFLPELILLVFAGIILVADLFIEDKRALPWVGILGLGASAVWTLLLIVRGRQGGAFQNTLLVDSYSLFFMFLFDARHGADLFDRIRAPHARPAG